MNKRIARSPTPINSIDYIVSNKPLETAELLNSFQYKVSEDLPSLISSAKRMVREKGEVAIYALLNLHPDKNLIIGQYIDDLEDQFCGACSTYSYNPENGACDNCSKKDSNEQLIQMQHPINSKQPNTEASNDFFKSMVKSELIAVGFCLLLGIAIGKALN